MVSKFSFYQRRHLFFTYYICVTREQKKSAKINCTVKLPQFERSELKKKIKAEENEPKNRENRKEPNE
jgi:hypothetical protein